MTRFAYSAVLFDMDGVVVDNMPLHRQVWAEFARTLGFNPSMEELRALDGRRAADIIAALHGEELALEEVTRLAKQRETLYRERLGSTELVPVPGVRAYLEALREAGVPRVLATSATPGNAEVVLERLNLAALFDARVTAADVTRGKPHPEVYLTAAGKVGVNAAECLVVEDALPGVRAAKAAGSVCLGLMTSEPEARLREVGADWVAPDFEGVPALLLPRHA